VTITTYKALIHNYIIVKRGTGLRNIVERQGDTEKKTAIEPSECASSAFKAQFANGHSEYLAW